MKLCDSCTEGFGQPYGYTSTQQCDWCKAVDSDVYSDISSEYLVGILMKTHSLSRTKVFRTLGIDPEKELDLTAHFLLEIMVLKPLLMKDNLEGKPLGEFPSGKTTWDLLNDDEY